MKEKLKKYIWYLFWAMCVIALINGVLYYFEKDYVDTKIIDYEDTFWYMFVTVASVGYGDITPVSPVGKVIGYIYVISSIGILGLFIGTITTNIQTMLEETKLGFNGTSFEHHILFIGWNEFSQLVADECVHSGTPVAIVTERKDDIDLIYSKYDKQKTFVLYSSYNALDMLEKVNADKAGEVFVCLNDDTAALIYVINFKKRYPNARIIVALDNANLEDTFTAAGVTYAISTTRIAAKLIASYIFEPDVAELNNDVLSSAKHATDFDNQQYLVTDKNPYLNKNCMETFIDLKKQFNCTLLGISKYVAKDEYKIITSPTEDVKVEINDYLIMMINGESKRLIQLIFGVSEGRL